MQRKLVVAAIVLSSIGIHHPVAAQSIQSPMDSQLNAPIASQPEARGRRVDVRLLWPVHSDSSAAMSRLHAESMMPFPQAGQSHRARNAIIGGVLGTVVGLGVCTAISNITDDSTKSRVSTCTTTGNLLFGAGGFAVGALIGAAIK